MLALRLHWPLTLVREQDPDYLDELIETLEELQARASTKPAPTSPDVMRQDWRKYAPQKVDAS